MFGEKPSEAEFRKTEVISDGRLNREYTDPAYLVAFSTWKNKVLGAYADHIGSLKVKAVDFQTDLTGNATVNLPEGTWKIQGAHSDSFSRIYWLHEVNVTKQTKLIELSNDNALTIVNTGESESPLVGLYKEVEAQAGIYIGQPTITPEKQTLTAEGQKSAPWMLLGFVTVVGAATYLIWNVIKPTN